jgi:O-Antigen ligase
LSFDEPTCGTRAVADDSVAIRLASALLVALGLVLPFEASLFHAGPLEITSVEIVLYLLLAAWGLDVARQVYGRRLTAHAALVALRDDPMVRAVTLWSVVLLASAITAPSYRAASLKFALRSGSGVLGFFAARTLGRRPGARRLILSALVAGALLSASTAVLEWLVPDTGSFWGAFRQSDFDTSGLRRACGVFAFPTIGAMYWEAAVPLVLVLPFLTRELGTDRPIRFAAPLSVLGTALLTAAILATVTRSGLAGAAWGCVALLGLGWRSWPSLRGAALGALGVLVLLVAVALHATTSGSLLVTRLHFWHDSSWFRARYAIGPLSGPVHVDQSLAVPVTLWNEGTLAWRRAGERPVRLGYHWERLRGSSSFEDYEGLRTDLPRDVPPGEKILVLAMVQGPRHEGAYRLRWDLLQEGVAWFSDLGNRTQDVTVEVVPPTDGMRSVADRIMPLPTVAPPPRSACWRAAVILWRERPLLGIGPDNFRRRYQAVLSPAPSGQTYTDTRIHANSLYFETLADLGLAGVGALGAIVVALLGSLRDHAAAGRLAELGCGVAAGAFFVHGALDYFFEFTPLFGLFWILLGLTAPAPSRSRPDTAPGRQT